MAGTNATRGEVIHAVARPIQRRGDITQAVEETTHSKGLSLAEKGPPTLQGADAACD